ncbi:hypothetical protein EDD22DRAFT_216377 [Suillus occidentalis]|nr:hypothetical protein EDD22DRAFT_216377 [Suillus occidentalis]
MFAADFDGHGLAWMFLPSISATPQNTAIFLPSSYLPLITSVPPVRLRLYHQSCGTYTVLSIHHALFDAISVSGILKYVEDAYLDKPLQNITPPEQILEHILFRDLTPAREHWTSTLRDFNWSYHDLVDVAQSASPKRISITFDTPLSYFQQMLAHCQVTLQATLTCTFASVLANHLCQSDDLIFGTIR